MTRPKEKDIRFEASNGDQHQPTSATFPSRQGLVQENVVLASSEPLERLQWRSVYETRWAPDQPSGQRRCVSCRAGQIGVERFRDRVGRVLILFLIGGCLWSGEEG